MQETKLLLGEPVATGAETYVATTIQKGGLQIRIAALLVGNNPASTAYVKKKEACAKRVGMNFEIIHFDEDVSEEDLVQKIEELNADPTMHGFIIQLPLPAHISPDVVTLVDPKKDIDGLHPLNAGKLFFGSNTDTFLPPATALAVMELLHFYHIQLEGKHVVIVGKSNIVGKPLALALLNQQATVTVCHKDTADLAMHTRQADIVISATGVAHLLGTQHIKPGAVTIDIGFSKKDGKLAGDIDFGALNGIVSAHAPVPGGVGPVTVSMLIKNALHAYMIQHPHVS